MDGETEVVEGTQQNEAGVVDNANDTSQAGTAEVTGNEAENQAAETTEEDEESGDEEEGETEEAVAQEAAAAPVPHGKEHHQSIDRL